VRDAVVGGFCLYSMPDGHPAVGAALRRGLPVVIVDEPPSRGALFVGIDDAGGARALAEHVRALGHERIAVVSDRLREDGRSGPADDARVAGGTYKVSRDRVGGFRAGAGRLLAVYECGGNEQEGGAQAARHLLAATPAPTALLCLTDQLALGAMQEARAQGLSVPGDVSITGFDDVPAAEPAGLTTMRQPLVEKGRQAGRLLVERDTEREVILPLELIARASTAPPRSG
jgi:DNA-binding LacI/PurR family transcriptional regulator